MNPKVKIKKIECGHCKKYCTQEQAIRVVIDKRKNIYADLCPRCFPKVYNDIVLRQAEIKTSELMKSGLYEQGARAIDVKEYMHKWTKKIAEQL